jgi:uncharacterized DUF497 family protein
MLDMDFVWDETKRLRNVAKHGFDFLQAEELFAGPHVIVPSRHSQPEERFLAIGKVADRWATVIYTIRDGKCRIISMRSARDAERRRCQDLHGR